MRISSAVSLLAALGCAMMAYAKPNGHVVFAQTCKGEKFACYTSPDDFERMVLGDSVAWAVLFVEEEPPDLAIVRNNFLKVAERFDNEPLKFGIVLGKALPEIYQKYNPHEKRPIVMMFRWKEPIPEELFHVDPMHGMWAPDLLDRSLREHLRGNPRQKNLPIASNKGNVHNKTYWVKRHKHEAGPRENHIHPAHKMPKHYQWESWRGNYHDMTHEEL